jgi:hypothetical protein
MSITGGNLHTSVEEQFKKDKIPHKRRYGERWFQ